MFPVITYISLKNLNFAFRPTTGDKDSGTEEEIMHQSFVSIPPPPPTGMGGDNDFSLFRALV